jgi:hypothetical protein
MEVMAQPTLAPSTPTCEDETVPDKQIYRDILEKYANTLAATPQQPIPDSNMQYMELGIYIFSGIIIIFLMEQILQIGKSLR